MAATFVMKFAVKTITCNIAKHGLLSSLFQLFFSFFFFFFFLMAATFVMKLPVKTITCNIAKRGLLSSLFQLFFFFFTITVPVFLILIFMKFLCMCRHFWNDFTASKKILNGVRVDIFSSTICGHGEYCYTFFFFFGSSDFFFFFGRNSESNFNN
jgi:hypothetical protein